mgnify:CR=1 FL=1
MGQNVKLSASPLQVIRTVNDKLMSYNVEMTEVTGGTFWKAYTPEQIAGTEKFSVGGASDIAAAMANLMQMYDPIDLKNEKLRKLAKEFGPVWVRVSGTWATKTYYDFDNNIYQAFVKEMGSSEDYAVFAETSFVSDGLDQIRFTATNKEGSGYVAFDNFTATYHSNIGGSVSADDEDVLDDTISLSAHSENADKVVFCVDDKPVTTFDKSADGNYEFETSFEDLGIKTFDVYLKQGNEYTVESQTFNYNPILKRNIKTFAGPFTTTLQSDGNCWTNVTSTSAYFAGRVVFEGDITLTSNTDMVYFELGGASDYNFTWGGENYITLLDALGYGTETPLFASNGKILDTDISYSLNTPINIKYVCDTVTDTYEFYVNGNLVATKKGTADYFGKQNRIIFKQGSLLIF